MCPNYQLIFLRFIHITCNKKTLTRLLCVPFIVWLDIFITIKHHISTTDTDHPFCRNDVVTLTSYHSETSKVWFRVWIASQLFNQNQLILIMQWMKQIITCGRLYWGQPARVGTPDYSVVNMYTWQLLGKSAGKGQRSAMKKEHVLWTLLHSPCSIHQNMIKLNTHHRACNPRVVT